MKKEKITEILEQCYQLDKLRSAERYIMQEHRLFRELGLRVRDLSDLNELDDAKGDKVLAALATQMEHEKRAFAERGLRKRNRQRGRNTNPQLFENTE